MSSIFLVWACESFEFVEVLPSFTEVNKSHPSIDSCGYRDRDFPAIPNWSSIEECYENTHNRTWKPYFLNKNLGFLIGGDEVILRTENGGSQWVGSFAGCDCVTYDAQFVNEQIGFVSMLERVDFPVEDFIHGGFLKTTDRGISWERLESPQLGVPREVFFFSEREGFAIFNQYYVRSNQQNRDFLAKTSDGGLTWAEIEGINPLGSSSNELYFDEVGFGYTGGENGIIYFTEDYGNTWSEISTNLNITAVQMIDAQNGFIDTYCQFLKTSDGGHTWEVISEGEVEAFHFFDEKKGVILKSVFTYDQGDYRDQCRAFLTTDNGGQTWNQGDSSFNFSVSGMDFIDQNRGFITNSGYNAFDCFRFIKVQNIDLEEPTFYE
ncbi:MAG: hypothetical protein AAGG68_30780 [Bacteroidota bacterium]